MHLAKWGGAKVITTCCPRDMERVKAAGADSVLDYSAADLATYGSANSMQPTLPFLPLLFKAVTIDIILIYLLPKPERDAMIAKLHSALGADALPC